MTFQIDFRTKDYSNCTAIVHEDSKEAALAWVRAHLAIKIGPFSKLVVREDYRK